MGGLCSFSLRLTCAIIQKIKEPHKHRELCGFYLTKTLEVLINYSLSLFPCQGQTMPKRWGKEGQPSGNDQNTPSDLPNGNLIRLLF
jgi:hypothetical protein